MKSTTLTPIKVFQTCSLCSDGRSRQLLPELVAAALRPLPHGVVDAHHRAAKRIVRSPERALVLGADLEMENPFDETFEVNRAHCVSLVAGQRLKDRGRALAYGAKLLMLWF